MNKKIVIISLLFIILMSGCNNKQEDKVKFEENEKIITLNENMSKEEMKDYFLSTIEIKKFHYGEVTYHVGATGYGNNYKDVKKTMYNAFIFFDKDNMNAYVINTDKNEKYIKQISEKS